MLKKEITYTDYLDVEKTETFRFHLSKTEIVQMEFKRKGGMKGILENIVETQDRGKLMDFFVEIIDSAYGVITPEGRFMKSPEALAEFKSTAAYDELVMELLGDADKAANFINGIIPNEAKEAANKAKLEVVDAKIV